MSNITANAPSGQVTTGGTSEPLSAKTIAEWRQSCVNLDIIRRNVWDLDYEQALPLIVTKFNEIKGHGTQYATAAVQRVEAAGEFLKAGGWWVGGLDPLAKWAPMEWGQFKPNTPRVDPDKGKLIKYESPWGTSARCIFLDMGPGYWPGVMEDLDLPLVITEGAKKSGAILSLGLPAVALPGITMGIRDGQLIPELKEITAGRRIIIAFDQDTKQTTRRNVTRAARTLSKALLENGATGVDIARWAPQDGKGIDDLIASSNPDDVRILLESAAPMGTQRTIEQVMLEKLYSEHWITLDGVLHRWVGTHYDPSPDEVETRRIATALDNHAVESVNKAGEVKITYPHARQRAVSNVLNWVKARFSVPTDRVNPTGAINLLNGVLVLNWGGEVPTWDLVPHDPIRWPFTGVCPYAYDPNADRTYAHQLLGGLGEAEQTIFLKVLGASLDLAQVRQRRGRSVKAILLHGLGANGKDSLREAATTMIGHQWATIAGISDFKQYDQGRKFPLSCLRWSRINWSPENVRINLDGIQSLKQAITGDPLSRERKGKDEEPFKPGAVFFFNVNDIPHIKAASEAIRSRFAILTFTKTFSENPDPSRGELQADPRFKDDPKFVREHIVPALLNMSLEALQDLIRNGIDYSAAEAALAKARLQSSHLVGFMEEQGLVVDPKASILVSEAWDRLRNWYLDNGFLELDNGGRSIWHDSGVAGDNTVRAINQVAKRLIDMAPTARIEKQPRPGGGKPQPMIVGLGFLKNSGESESEPQDQPPRNPSVTQDQPPRNPVLTQESSLGYAAETPAPQGIQEPEDPARNPSNPSNPNISSSLLCAGDKVRFTGSGPIAKTCGSKILTIESIDDAGIATCSHPRWLVKNLIHVDQLSKTYEQIPATSDRETIAAI